MKGKSFPKVRISRKRRRYYEYTDEQMIDILKVIFEINDDRLRERITNELMEGLRDGTF